jgi:hypothetical protein
MHSLVCRITPVINISGIVAGYVGHANNKTYCAPTRAEIIDKAVFDFATNYYNKSK